MMYSNRTVCCVLEEMRAATKTLNFGGLLGSIEEVQGMVNRMESKLESYKDIGDLDERWTVAKKKDRALQYMKRQGFLKDDDE